SGDATAASPSVAVVGGGLAGLAATVALQGAGCRVELFEARRFLGGRAASFRDPATGEVVDLCQHVSMGCCTNLADFCRRLEISDCFRRDRTLHFIGPDGRQFDFRPLRWLPAPLHLLRGFCNMGFLSMADRLAIARALWRLMRLRAADCPSDATIGGWLAEQKQPTRAIERFWTVILVSTLGERLERASLAAARKVLVDGFLASSEASTIEVPRVPLAALYGERMESWLAAHDVALHSNSPIRQVECDDASLGVRTASDLHRSDFVILAVPWSKVRAMLTDDLANRWPGVADLARIESSPITGVHLWFDRPIMDLPHAVLVGRLGQWIFRRPTEALGKGIGHYYQVVISASHDLAGRDRQAVVDDLCGELAAIWPEARKAKLLRSRIVADPDAVFSVQCGSELFRPPQQTPIPGLLVAGDWTATGWPATMEGAVRSGYLAAESILEQSGRPRRLIVPDLSRGLLARLCINE
ncbi:MAG TPA: hydroxysqualene dehydroxylase HpnE, partial [Pirellulales bacterium]|nr:hydroxysqualene dehydroxylase HpnE [Pirellulales bacterium]